MITVGDIDLIVSHARQSIMMDDFLAKLCMTFIDATVQRHIYYRFLYELVAARKPRVCLELGVEYGLASAHMCSASRVYGGNVVGIDINRHEVPATRLNEVYGNYTFMNDDSIAAYEAVKSFVSTFGKIGVVYQDSSHHYAQSVEEWNHYSMLLDENAVWICDDITKDFMEIGVDEKSMAEYWSELPYTKKVYPQLYPDGTNNLIGVMICE